MPWVRAQLRGQLVYARAHASGELSAEGGLVEVRYKPNDGRAYRAAERNLTVVTPVAVLPEDTCGPAAAAAQKKAEPAPSAADDHAGSGVSAEAPVASVANKATKKAAKKSAANTESAQASATSQAATLGAHDIIAYTDGACSGNPGPAGCGMVLTYPNGDMREGYEYLGHATNNIAELVAIQRAVEALPPGTKRASIYTDSSYSIGVLSKGWKAKANQELIAKILSVLKQTRAAGCKLEFSYVKGHAGIPLNEKADELARKAITARASQAVMPR
jgi:ribonuclease HI